MSTSEETEAKALAFLHLPRSCTELGEYLWSGSGRNVNRQSYERPAGKLIKRLVAKGSVARAMRVQEKRRRTGYCPSLYVSTEVKHEA